jgi:hypothetical protein
MINHWRPLRALRIKLIIVMITVAEDTGTLSAFWALWFLTLLAGTPAGLGDP